MNLLLQDVRILQNLLVVNEVLHWRRNDTLHCKCLAGSGRLRCRLRFREFFGWNRSLRSKQECICCSPGDGGWHSRLCSINTWRTWSIHHILVRGCIVPMAWICNYSGKLARIIRMMIIDMGRWFRVRRNTIACNYGHYFSVCSIFLITPNIVIVDKIWKELVMLNWH